VPNSPTPTDSAPRYPRWSDRLIRQLDTFAATRSRAEKVPALILTRQDGGDVRAPAFMVREYEHRLSRRRGNPHFQVPHAVVDDAEMSGGFLAAIDRVGLRFQLTMPSGRLRLPAFHTSRAVLDCEPGAGDFQAQQQPILDDLYAELLKRRKTLHACARLADFLGQHLLTGWLTSRCTCEVAASGESQWPWWGAEAAMSGQEPNWPLPYRQEAGAEGYVGAGDRLDGVQRAVLPGGELVGDSVGDLADQVR
jgi:hypothetical protein